MTDVCTALTYLYKGCIVCTSSSPEITSPDDAKACVLFAHKYGIKDLLDAGESYLVKVARRHMSRDGPLDLVGSLFTSFEALSVWTELADTCNLATLLAYLELLMIRDADMDLWFNLATTSSKINRGSLFRMLRASQLFIHRQKGVQAKCKDSQRMCFGANPRTVTQTLSALAPDHHVNIATLMEWKREMP